MIIRPTRWFFVAFLFIVGPLLGLAAGAAAGAHLTYTSFETAQERPAQESTFSTPAVGGITSEKVTLPNGQRVALNELAPERKVAIVVMKDPHCQVCQRQLRVLSDRLAEVQQQGGVVFGLSDANRCQNKQLMSRLGLKFPILSDPEHHALTAFDMAPANRPHVTPGVIFIDENGQVESVHLGRSPGQHQEEMIIQRLR